jgi:hypothetical protein
LFNSSTTTKVRWKDRKGRKVKYRNVDEKGAGVLPKSQPVTRAMRKRGTAFFTTKLKISTMEKGQSAE